ncbi:ATP-binding cassette sub-family C member 11 [Symbiodinium microadriaticum]|uniref:ATP-binding cassette sub-family C member 11 n=1 Tax=Symbiodinium microadriaticum TaxID=2951 RepID=A0A1Q9C288_SYMMI|nr:ATP-binding cassette sub-family C member 11 [Symbiodinium microadriaticum]
MDQLSQRDQMQVMAALNEMQMQEMMNTYNNLVERCFNECITSFRTKAFVQKYMSFTQLGAGGLAIPGEAAADAAAAPQLKPGLSRICFWSQLPAEEIPPGVQALSIYFLQRSDLNRFMLNAVRFAFATLAVLRVVTATDSECLEADCGVVEDETPLLDVQLLQKSLRLTPSKPSALEAVEADGSVTAGEADIHPLEEHSLLQTSIEVGEAENMTEVLGMDGWRLRPNASCFVEGLLPVSGTKSLLVQLGTVHELSNEVEHSSFSISSFLFADSTQLRATLLLSIYVAIYFFSVVSMYYHMTTVRPVGKGTPLPGYTKRETCPEDEILQSHSYLSWLCVTWLSPMVARLGHSWNSAMSKCSPDEVPPVNGPEFQAFRQCERFEALWEEEVRNRGQEEASILRVVCKLWGYQRLFWFHMSLFVHVVLGNLYQVFLIQMSLSYFFWLQEEVHQNNGQLPDMTKPILVSIAAFSAQPLVFAILCSFEANLSMKFDQCIAGVAVAMFKKTQRLPASVLSQDKPVGSEDQHQLAEKVSKKPNAMMTINNDVIGNFHGLTFNVSLTINATVTVAVLLVLMAFKLRLATLFCLAVAIPALTVSVILSGAMGINMMQLQDVQDKRVYLLREVLKGIRIVKCYAWESAMEEQIKRIRGRELSMLGVYFRLCSHFVVLFNLFPRVLTAAGLWGFLHLIRMTPTQTSYPQIQAFQRMSSVALLRRNA